MTGDIVLLSILLAVIVIAVVSILRTALRGGLTRGGDGHVIPPGQDITCERQYRHRHADTGADRPGERYIVHEDPETGYVILNGIKRRITDCRNI